jgi:hypothetical protein
MTILAFAAPILALILPLVALLLPASASQRLRVKKESDRC